MFSHERFKKIVAIVERHSDMTVDLMSGIEDNYKNVMLVTMFYFRGIFNERVKNYLYPSGGHTAGFDHIFKRTKDGWPKLQILAWNRELELRQKYPSASRDRIPISQYN